MDTRSECPYLFGRWGGQVGANGPTWLEGAGHAFLDLGGGEALEGVWGELEEEEEVSLEYLDSGGMSAMDPLEEGEGAPSSQASRDEVGWGWGGRSTWCEMECIPVLNCHHRLVHGGADGGR